VSIAATPASSTWVLPAAVVGDNILANAAVATWALPTATIELGEPPVYVPWYRVRAVPIAAAADVDPVPISEPAAVDPVPISSPDSLDPVPIPGLVKVEP
jgi:hypothetical protein